MPFNETIKVKMDEVAFLLEQVKLSIDSEVEPRKEKFNYLQYYLYFNHYPIFSFTQSVLSLCKEGRSVPAGVLLRSLVEAHISVNYHQKGDWKRKLAISAKTGMENRLMVTEELQKLIKKYPTFETEDETSLLNKTGLKVKRDQCQKDIQGIIRGSTLTDKDNDINLEQKAMQCDVGLIGKDIGAFEYLYRLAYRYLSPATHLGVQGLEYFVDKGSDGNFVFSQDGNEGLHIGQAIDIYLAFVRDLVEQKLIDKLPEKYAELEKLNTELVKMLL